MTMIRVKLLEVELLLRKVVNKMISQKLNLKRSNQNKQKIKKLLLKRKVVMTKKRNEYLLLNSYSSFLILCYFYLFLKTFS